MAAHTAGPVLVTGASSGIGEATAKHYAAAGAHVLLLARNQDRLSATSDAIRRSGGKASVYPLDLGDAEAVEETGARILRETGAPSILINNAGAGRWLPLLETSADAASAMMAVPYLAAFNLTRALLPPMIARGSGAIAFITSPASFLAWPNATAYIAARRAMAGLADGLRSELRKTRLTVTLVVLGTVESPYWENNPGSREHLPAADPRLVPTLTTDEAAEAIAAGIAAGKRMVVKPAIFRALFLLNALAPALVTRQLGRAARKSTG